MIVFAVMGSWLLFEIKEVRQELYLLRVLVVSDI